MQTLEKITISNDLIGWIDTRGSIANLGVSCHLSDAHLDPGTDQKIFLQLKNHSAKEVIINAREPVVKVYFALLTD